VGAELEATSGLGGSEPVAEVKGGAPAAYGLCLRQWNEEVVGPCYCGRDKCSRDEEWKEADTL
jgi:hypothetical protein